MVFLHGFGNDAHVWDEIVPQLAPYYRALAISLRGHGDSDWGEQPGYDHSLLLADVEAALASLEFERLVLVGHSLGGRVAMRYAGAHPERMAGLVVVDSGPQMDARGTSKIREEVRGQMRKSDASFASPEEYARVLVRQYPAARIETLERLAVHWTRPRADGRYELKQDLRPPKWASGGASSEAGKVARQRTDEAKLLWDALAKVPCPTLVVRGAASDVLAPEVADRMVDEVIPHGQLAVVSRAGHSVMLDNPAGFLTALTDFTLG